MGEVVFLRRQPGGYQPPEYLLQMINQSVNPHPRLYARALRQYQTACLMTKLGYASRASELFQESAGVFLRCGADGWLQAARIHNEVGRQALDGCQYEAALQAGQAAEKILETHPLEPGSRTQFGLQMQTLSLLGEVNRQLARYEQAEVFLQRSLDCAVDNFGADDELTANARNQLGMLYKYTGEFERAGQLYRTALASLLPRTGREHSLVAALYHNLGGLAHASADFAGGEEPARTAWEINRRLLGDDHPTTQADAVAYAALLDGLGRHAESEPIYRHALALYEKIYPPVHFEIATVLNNLAGACYARGNTAEAEALFRRALAIKEQLLGPDHPDTALTANNLGVLLKASGRQAEGSQLVQRALIVFQARLRDGHPRTELARGNLVGSGPQNHPNR